MATYSTYPTGQTIAHTGGPYASAPSFAILTGTFDASKRNLAAADVVELINVPAGTYVAKVFYKVQTADATQTLNVGDGADVDGWVAAADVGTAGNTAAGGGAFAAAGKYYTTADTIDLEVPSTKALDTLKVVVSAFCYMV